MHVRDLESRCPPDVARIPGPKAYMFQLLGLETSIGRFLTQKDVLADSRCLFEDELVPDKNVIARHWVRHHKLGLLSSDFIERPRSS